MNANQSTRKSPVSHSAFKYEDGVVSVIVNDGTVNKLNNPETQNLLSQIAKQVQVGAGKFVERAPAQVLEVIKAAEGIASDVVAHKDSKVVTLSAVTAVSPNNEVDGGRSNA